MGSIENKHFWTRWVWERPWIGYPSYRARKLGWVAPSHPYPSGFIPVWDFFVWRDFARLADMRLAFEAPDEIAKSIEHEGEIARQIEFEGDYILLYKTIEEKFPFPPEWELVRIRGGGELKRRLGYFSKFPNLWELR